MYLTFDDGPEPATTMFILDQLDRFGFKATFFMVGENVIRHPELVEEIVGRGHSTGNHTMHHSRGMGMPRGKYIEEVENETPLLGSRLFRPPHGFMRLSQYKWLKSRYRIVMFDIVTRDYDGNTTPEQILENVKRHTRRGSIIVFHDSLKARPRLVKALPAVLQWLKDNGYESRGIAMD